MAIWKQTSLFTYREDQTLENIIPTLKLFGEPTPYKLVRNGLERFSNPGELVLDPCCGTGTTGSIAVELKRRAVMSDLNQLAVQTGKSLFQYFDYQQVMTIWQELESEIGECAKEDDSTWAKFVQTRIPSFPAFKRVRTKFHQIQDLFDPADLMVLKGIYLGIQKLRDQRVRELLLVVLGITLTEASLLTVSRNGWSFYIPKKSQTQYPKAIFAGKLELYLIYKSLIGVGLAEGSDWTPEVHLASAYQLDYLPNGSVDYILCHLPGVGGYSEWEMSYLGELLIGELTNPEEEIQIELDFRGRYRFIKDIAHFLQEMERVLKEKRYLTLIFPSHNVLLSLMVRVAQNHGWDLIQEYVEIMRSGQKEEYPMMSLTLQKRKPSTVLGALNKMKAETLYDTEEAILRKIEQFLTENGSGTTEEIQRFLIEHYLHDCLIEKPLEDLLQENFLWTGRFWLKPSAEQKEKFYRQRLETMAAGFPEFVREMIYYFLQEEQRPLGYVELAERFLKMKPRMIFHTPYYRLWMEQCEKKGVELHQLMEEYFERQKQQAFETYEQVLKRLTRNDEVFVELQPGESVGLTEWSDDDYFKIYLELYEKARKKEQTKEMQLYGQEVLDRLGQVTYLEGRKLARIREYILRSERE